MEDGKIIADLVKALNGIQVELQQMNKTLSSIAGQGRQSAGEPAGRAPAGRPSAGRPPAGRPPMRSTRSGGYKRAEAGESEEGTGDQGFRFPKKKSPARPKGKLPPKKGGGYPKKPR